MEWYLQHNIKYGRKKMMMPIQKWERHSISFLSPLCCFASYIFCFNKIWEVWVFIFVSMNQTNTISHTFIFISIFLPSNSKDFIHRRRKKLGCISIFRNQKYANTIYHGCVRTSNMFEKYCYYYYWSKIFDRCQRNFQNILCSKCALTYLHSIKVSKHRSL